MPNVECAICAEEFGKRSESSDVIVTPCGHVFHELCLSKWLHHSVPTSEPKSCPECRQPVTMTQTRRIYFTLSTTVDNIQNHLEFLDQVILNKNSKLHMATMQLEKLKSEWTNKLREKDYEIQRLYEKLKHREQDYEVQKLHAKIEKLKLKLRETRHKHTAYPKISMGAVQLSMSENIGMPMYPPQFSTVEATHTNAIRIQQTNCDASTSIFSQSSGQTSTTSTTVQNPFECDINAMSSSLRTIRNPLATFTPTYQSQNGYMSTNPMQSFSTIMNPIQPPHAHTGQTGQQQTIAYNQTGFFLPIQATNSINTAYFNPNDQNHFMGQ